MTDKATLLALAERVGAATGPSYALEVDITRAVNPQATRLSKPAPYTASLDAALSLVPEGFWQEIKGPRRYLNIPTNSPNFWSAYLSSYNHEGDVMGWGATPALALCAAALRARAETLP